MFKFTQTDANIFKREIPGFWMVSDGFGPFSFFLKVSLLFYTPRWTTSRQGFVVAPPRVFWALHRSAPRGEQLKDPAGANGLGMAVCCYPCLFETGAPVKPHSLFACRSS